MRHRTLVTGLAAMAVTMVAGRFAAPARADLDPAAWRDLDGRFKKAFGLSLPLKDLFPSPSAERKKCQQTPNAAKALEARGAERRKRADQLQQHQDLRAERPAVITDLGKADDARALEALALGLRVVNEDLKGLAKLEKEYADALQIYAGQKTITNDGNFEWNNWLKTQPPVISGLITAESRSKHAVLDAFGSVRGGSGLTWLREALLKNKSDEVRAGAALALGASDAEGNAAALVAAYPKEKHGMVRAACIDGLLTRRATSEKATFLAALKDEVWEVRAAAIDAIDSLECKGPDVIEALIETLVVEDGRLRGDLEAVLHRLTGMRFFADGLLWRKWWADNKEKFAADAPPKADAEKGDGGPTVSSGDLGAPVVEHGPKKDAKADFYGIQTFSNRIVFVLDRSGSMNEKSGTPPVKPGGPVVTGGGHKGGQDDPGGGPEGDTKLDAARWELKKAIMGLASDVKFTLIFYHNGVDIWKPDLQAANRANKKESLEYVWDLPAQGSTNISDALKRAFEIGMPAPGEVQDAAYGKRRDVPDTIFLLSDGSPCSPDGKILPTGPILEDVRKWNKLRRVVIHTIGIGQDNRGFMQALAKENGGTYVHRD